MIRVRQVKVDVLNNESLPIKIAHKLNINVSDISNYKIIKESIDARDKRKILYIYEVDVSVKDEEKILKKHLKDVLASPNDNYVFPVKINNNDKTVVIVGSGPAGLFAAYILALNNIKPIIIERGEDVDNRVKSVSKFFDEGVLNEESNVQFGEGGAGTFSDGKLHTLVKDKKGRMKKVLETFVLCGAPSEITYCYKPHIGTDLLRIVVKNMRDMIISMGGLFRYNTKLTDIFVKENSIKAIQVNNDEIINCDNLILAIGNSARDTFKMLYKNKLNIESKPFAVGIRVQHPQSLIDKSQYGNSKLSKASYKLTYTTKLKRGVYSFCMCPGGYVINASSSKGYLAINGMSNYDRESINANSAIVVTVNKEDFGYEPLDGIKYQERLEKKAYDICQGKIPVQLYKDFLNKTKSTSFKSIKPIFKGTYEFADINQILPEYILGSIKEAMTNFGDKIKLFDSDDVIIAGVESRTSSPIRILRDEFLESNIKGIFPCGEGAGYAGGITSSAIDGIKVAEQVALKINKVEILKKKVN